MGVICCLILVPIWGCSTLDMILQSFREEPSTRLDASSGEAFNKHNFKIAKITCTPENCAEIQVFLDDWQDFPQRDLKNSVVYLNDTKSISSIKGFITDVISARYLEIEPYDKVDRSRIRHSSHGKNVVSYDELHITLKAHYPTTDPGD